MTTGTVAVAIPTWNRGHFLAATLASVFRQTRPPDEVHIVDDGSTDDSVAVIERAFADAGPTRCFLTTREHRGISATRNELCAAVTTDFIAFLDSDDLYAPTRLEHLLESAPHDGHYFSFSGVDFHGEPDAVERVCEWRDEYRLRLAQGMSFPTAGFAFLRSNVAVTASNFIISRGLFDAVGGFDEQLRICEDWDFALRSLRFVEPAFVPEPLLTYRLHARNASRDARDKAAAIDVAAETLRAWIGESAENPRAPTPRNWPHYFRIFAGFNTNVAGQALAGRLSRDVLDTAAALPATAEESAAIRALVASARAPQPLEELSTCDLMRACSRTWNSRT